MFIDHRGPRLMFQLGGWTNDDDPRGRDINFNIGLGIPDGSFDDSVTGPAQYGTWDAWAVLWRWGVRVAVRGPIVGHYPPDPYDDEPECGALHPEGDGPCIMLAGHAEQGSHAAEHHTGTGKAWT